MAAVTAATEKLLSKLLVPADPVAVTALGDAVSKEDLDTLTKGHMPSISKLLSEYQGVSRSITSIASI